MIVVAVHSPYLLQFRYEQCALDLVSGHEQKFRETYYSNNISLVLTEHWALLRIWMLIAVIDGGKHSEILNTCMSRLINCSIFLLVFSHFGFRLILFIDFMVFAWVFVSSNAKTTKCLQSSRPKKRKPIKSDFVFGIQKETNWKNFSMKQKCQKCGGEIFILFLSLVHAFKSNWFWCCWTQRAGKYIISH